MPDITQPLRLAVGSHKAGSGMGCAMNVISWENGDTEITDFPACSDWLLSRLVQMTNDTICGHTKVLFFVESDLSRFNKILCPECSIKVLDLGHRTVGTACDPKTASGIYIEIIDRLMSDSKKLVNANINNMALFDLHEQILHSRFQTEAMAILANFDESRELAVSTMLLLQDLFGPDMTSLSAYVSKIIDLFHEVARTTPQTVTPEVTEQAISKMLTKV